MPATRTINVKPPLGGVARQFAYQWQEPLTTPHAVNVWPFDPVTGRARMSSRAGLTAFTSGLTGVPYGWCNVSYVNSGTKYGVAVVTDGGAFVWNGTSWTEWITTAPGTDFTSVTCYLQTLYMARGGGTCLFRSLTGSAGAGAALSTVTTAGTAPTNCGLIVAHGDRLFLAGDTSNPHVLYAPRVAVPTDWDYSATDPAAAWASSGAQGGALQEPITALKSHTRDCLLIGHTYSLSVLRGNPTAGGQAEILSHEVGPLSHQAWCHDGQGTLWILTGDGLYTMPPGCGDFLKSVSREKLPDELVAINPGAGDYVSVAYDHRWRGLHIYVDYSSGTDAHWFYDMRAGGFYQMTFATTLRLGVPIKRSATGSKSGLVAIDSSGTASQFDENSTEAFATELWYGPFQLGDVGMEGLLNAVQAAVGADSDALSWAVYAGNSPEQAFRQVTPAFTGIDWAEGLNHWQHPMTGGDACYLKVFTASGTNRWSIENLTLTLRQLGMRRVR